jgi:hypothetical protein
MGYNIELSFNVLKSSSISEQILLIKNLANEYNYNYLYDDYEYSINKNDKKTTCVMLLNFDNINTNYLVKFLRYIKSNNLFYIEVIYDENSSQILYASQYYLTDKMNKHSVNQYKKNKRVRSYSEDDTLILNTISPVKSS